jgi:large subunit ribosomal protein L3
MKANKSIESGIQQRIGLIFKKEGMTSYYGINGVLGCTILTLPKSYVVGHKTIEKNGYNALQIAYEPANANRVSRPIKGIYSKNKVPLCKYMGEFLVSKDGFIDIGTELSIEHFINGQLIDASAITIGKGFAGVMKRHNFRGLEATHGVSIAHRSHGSTGQCQDPGKVFKGKKMAGQMGNSRVTIQNLEVIDIDTENSLLVVKGCVPGHKGSYVEIKDAVKAGFNINVPFPTAITASNNVAGNDTESGN